MPFDNITFIDIEGTDGSGKETQSKLLVEALRNLGYEAILLHFPQYHLNSSAMVHNYLAGQYGKDPRTVNPKAASMMYALDRFHAMYALESPVQQCVAGGKPAIVVLDRYTYSNVIHQCSKLPESQQLEMALWLKNMEFEDLGLPEPDLVLFLDADSDVVSHILVSREQKDGVLHDIHERDTTYLKASRATGLRFAEEFGWEVIPVLEGNAFRDRRLIHSDILAKVLGCITGK